MPINLEALGAEEEPQPAEDFAKRLARQLVAGKSREELLTLAGAFVKQQASDGQESLEEPEGMPQTPDELWDYIVRRYGIRIARVAVCHDHDTPFDFVCAGFFGWYPNVFAIGSRGGGKSYDTALLHDLNSHFKPGAESATFGAVEGQAKRVYSAFKTFVDPEEISGKSLMSETNYKPVGGMPYGSKVEVLGGTVAAVNSPHPQYPHSDEVEIMRADTWRESRNLAADKVTPDGRRIRGLNLATSTMKWKGGRVWQILQKFLEAKKQAIERYGNAPENKELVDNMITKTAPFYVLTYCLFEVAEQVPNCFPGGTFVESDGVTGGFKRWYEGPLVKVVDAAGDDLSGTPNHPVLTTHGWKPLGEIQEGDQLVRAVRREDVLAADPDIEDVPASIEQVYDLLALTSSERTLGCRVDFHGDVADGDVDVVLADSALRLTGQASVAKPVEEHAFTYASGGESSLLASGAPDQLCICGRRTSSSGVSGGRQRGAFFGRHSGHAEAHRFATGAGGDAVAPKEAGDCRSVDAVLLGQALMGGAFEVSVSDVVQVERTSFWAGHVFNLQTEAGAYLGNSIVVHNCRSAPENAHLPEWAPGLDRDQCKCDCVLPWTRIAINGELHAGFRRRYDGPVIDLVTASGKRLSVTPNHPVLTARGWVAAHALAVGDDVISCTSHDAATAADLDQVPPSAEDVFASLFVQATSVGTDSITPSGVDFHGDGVFTEGEVEFVRAERELADEGHAALAQQFGERFFAIRNGACDTSCAQMSQQRIDRHAVFLSQRGRRLASGVAVEDLLRGLEDDTSAQNAELVEPVLENGLGDARTRGDGLVLLASAVGGDDLVGDQLVGLRAQQTAPAEVVFEPLALATDRCGSGGDGHSGLVEFDRLVKIEVKRWRGHVYNFSSSTESYSANGIIVHNCHEIVNGTLESRDADGNLMPRTLESECRGRFYRSRGHRSRGEVIQLFMQNDERTWKAQQLCRETETEGLFIPNFSRTRHGLARFSLDPSNGPLYSGTDWGFVDESAVVWIQYLERPVEALAYDGSVKILPRGARVAFAELTIAQKTATELGQMAIVREVKLANVLSVKRVPVRRRWADIQGAGDRRDWAKMGLKTARYSTRDFNEHVKEWRGLVDADRFFIVTDEDNFTGMGCPFLCDQIEGWRAEEGGKESRELPQHTVSAARYCLYGMHDLYQDSGAQSPEQTEAQKMSQGTASAPAAVAYAGPSAYGDRELLQAETDWRARV